MMASLIVPLSRFAAEAGAHGAGHGGVGWFSPANTYFWVGLGFVLFIALVARKAWAGISQALDTRTARIQRQIDEARQLREEAQKQLAEDQRKQRQASKDAEAIVAQAKEDAKALKQQAEKDAEALIERRTQAVESRIAQLEKNAVVQVRTAAAHAAVAAARQALADEMAGEAGQKALDDAIVQVDKRLH